ncbi:TetR/AcrR family transcriptional regulator [Limnobacter parvus]|uniref:TetR family transcriptional regulator n=1 Tax=Limnobacter parvus TaxID=2939690 RepID=A0ABT1XJK1_9BURK|nr:TetR/AcrR family transcriptional regulator [Limnobacter parvus]MCR2747455.1 TetR family transcriptional regulator [Limnobacter parvus]
MNQAAEFTPVIDTREQLLRIALNEFAQHGIEGVTLSKIRQRSGQHNRSAVHYHFKSKEKLVEEVVDFVNAQLDVYCRQAHAEFALGKPEYKEWTRLSELIFDPFLKLFASGETGAICIQFLSRLTWQTGEQGQGFLTRFFNPYMAVFSPTMQEILPQYSETQLRFKIHLAVNTAIHGLADFSMVMHDETLRPFLSQAGGPKEMRRLFHDYVSAGLKGN